MTFWPGRLLGLREDFVGRRKRSSSSLNIKQGVRGKYQRGEVPAQGCLTSQMLALPAPSFEQFFLTPFPLVNAGETLRVHAALRLGRLSISEDENCRDS